MDKKVDEHTRNTPALSNMEGQCSFYASEIYKAFDSLRKFTKGYQIPSDADWKRLVNLFSTCFTRYYTFISKDNILTQDQLRLCILLRLGFLESEMMLLMGRSHRQSINKIKSQVNNKLFGKNGARSLRDNLMRYFC